MALTKIKHTAPADSVVTGAGKLDTAFNAIDANTTNVATNTSNIATNTSTIAGHTTSIGIMLPQSVLGISLSRWPGIDPTGATNNQSQFLAAYTAALAAGVRLIVDCKCWISVTTDDTKCIFLRTGTFIEGTPSGELIVDNSGIPTFIFHHSTDFVVRHLKVKYIGAYPWDMTIAPYAALIAHFNDVTMKGDMTANFGNTFSGSGSSCYVGTTNPQSIFRFMGGCARGVFDDVRIRVAQGVNAASFVAVAYSLDPQWTPSTLVTNNSQAITASVAVIPTDIDFINCRLDGVCMGFVGSGGCRIHGLKSYRYSDVQKSDGTGAGGNALYFAPPHLIYFADPDVSFTGWQRDIRGIYDNGVYVGGATRRAGNTSGTLLSLKIAPCSNTVVDGYVSLRPDGFADIITNTYGNQFGNISNCYFVYDSSVVTSNASSVWGVRFPSIQPYNYLTINGLIGRDINPSPPQFPIVDMGNILNQNCDIKGVKMYLNDWPTGNTNYPGFGMSGNNMSLDADYYFNQYSADQTLRGSFCNQGTACLTNSDIDVRVHGFRLFPVAFATAPAGTSTALAANWGHNSGTYLVQFSDNEVRYCAFTNGATTCTWTGALTGQATTGASGTGSVATITYTSAGAVAAVGSTVIIAGVTPAGYNGTQTVTASAQGSVSFASATTGAQTVAGTISCFQAATAQNSLAANYGGYKQRMLTMQGGKGIGNRIRMMDVTNGHESISHNGVVHEYWTQTYSGTPTAGLTFDLPISIPATHNPDLAAVFVQVALGTSGGLTSFALGWAATAAALANTISPSINTNVSTAYAGPITTNAGTSRVLRLTATGGTGFDGTGNVLVTVRAASVSGST